MVNYFDLWADLTSSNGAWRWWIAVQCTVSCLSSLSPDNPGCYRVLETAANFKRGGYILSILIDSPPPSNTEHWYGAPGGPEL